MVGDAVIRTGEPIMVELGPGLMSRFADPLQQPLTLQAHNGNNNARVYLQSSNQADHLDRTKLWTFSPARIHVRYVSRDPIPHPRHSRQNEILPLFDSSDKKFRVGMSSER
jgi:vacuolar-type H+-ATPase catalytic subunit A/Vma1